jgi:hypothetical protein
MECHKFQLNHILDVIVSMLTLSVVDLC